MNKKYLQERRFGVEKTAEVCMIWPTAAANQMEKIVEQCHITDTILSTDGRIIGNAPLATRAGFVAEEIHAETFNLEAILKDKDIRAFTDRYPNTPLSMNNPINDIAIMQDNQQIQGAQLKYCKDGQTTANAFRETRDGIPHYKETDAMIGPSDQLQGIKDAARRTEFKNQETRPSVAEAAKDVQKKVSDRLQQDGVESKPLSKKGAENLTKENNETKRVHRNIQDEYKNASTLQQTTKAAGAAAVVTTVIAGTINTVRCLDKVKKGEMAPADATLYILKNTAIAASDSALKAASATVAVSLTARILPELFKGSMLQSSLATGAVAGTAICAVDIVECLVMVAAGRMTLAEMENRTGRNVFQTGSGVVGASIGATLGAPAGPIGSMIGAMIGGMITSVAMTVAIDNHIEKPFREIMDNTKSLVQAENLMKNSVEYMAQSESMFEDFKIGMFLSEQDFNKSMTQVQQKREVNWKKINLLK